MMERALANARHPRRGCRAVLFLAGLSFACWAAHGETACDQVHESRRAQCLTVMACMMVDDDEIRRTCIDAAQRQPVPPPEQAPPEQTTREQPVQEATALERSRQAPQEQPAREEAAPVQKPKEPAFQERQVEPVIWEEDRRPGAEAPPPPRREPASEFNGSVSRIYQSILDRQLIAIDGAYLFESDRAAHARLEVGERVEVEKASSRFWTGRKWRIIGPSRTPIVAFRVRCESEDIRVDDRRKCVRMLDRRP